MKNNKFFLAAIVGSVAFFFLGWLVYGVLLIDFMNSHSGLGAAILSNLSAGFLIAAILLWGNFTTVAKGAKAGAIIALLMCMSYDFGFLAFTNLYTLSAVFADIIANLVMTSIVGALIGWLLEKGTTSTN